MNVKSYTQPVTQDVRRIQIDMTSMSTSVARRHRNAG